MLKKPVKAPPKKRLRAAAQKARYAEEDYASEEPNVRLSRAFVVVLLLHVVAVGGIFAFSALKDHQAVAPPGGKPEKPDPASMKSSTVQQSAQKESGAPEKFGTKGDAQRVAEASRQPGSNSRSQNPLTQVSAVEGGKTYVVQKGDSPAGIAKKFKVNYADLLKTNNIEDPKKLQIGQKLLIP